MLDSVMENPKIDNIADFIYQPTTETPFEEIKKFCGLYPLGQVSMLAADAGTGKSWFAMYSMMRASVGRDIYDNDIEPQSSLCFKGEMNTTQLNNRFHATRLSHCDKSRIHYILSDDLMLKGIPCSLSDESFREIVQRAIQKYKPSAVFFDSFGFFNTCDENAMKDMTELFQWLLTLANYYNTAVILVHHLRKRSNMDRGRKRNMDDISGSGAIKRYSGTIYMMDTASSSTSSESANPRSIRIENKKSGDIKKPPFIFTMESCQEDTGELSQDVDDKTFITFKVRDANNEDIPHVNKETTTQGREIESIIREFMMAQKREVITSELITQVHEYIPEVSDRIIRDTIMKMSQKGEYIVRLEQKRGREFVYALPEKLKAKLENPFLVEDDDKVTH